MNKKSFLAIFYPLKAILVCCVLVACGQASAKDRLDQMCDGNGAPASIAGSDIILQIENTLTQYPSGYPFKGAVVMHYKHDGSFTADGTTVVRGDEASSEQQYFGNYKYQRTGFNTATEKAIDRSLNAPYITKYTFETATSGKWQQDFDNGKILFNGSFSLVPSTLPQAKHLAPQTIAGLTIGLTWNSAVSTDLPVDAYPKRGLAVQTYKDDDTMLIKGYGAKTLDSHGLYHYKKISANVAIEDVTQINDIFTLRYTMVYIFETPNSGKWFQNLGDGLIKFSGTFATFQN